MEFNYIINPESGKRVSINAKTGKKILNKYLQKLGGNTGNPTYKAAVQNITRILGEEGLNEQVNTALAFVRERIQMLVDGYPIMTPFKSAPLKRADRIVEKVQRSNMTLKEIAKSKWTAKKLLNKIGDYARGSVIMSKGINVCFAVKDILRAVVYDNGGAVLIKCKSFLRIGDGYIGTNIVVGYRGIPIEIQCHTKESYAAKKSFVMISDYHRLTLDHLAEIYKKLMKADANDDTHAFLDRTRHNVKTTRLIKQHHAYRLTQVITHMLSVKTVMTDKEFSIAMKNIRRALIERMVENEVEASGELTRYCVQASLLHKGSFGKKCKDTVKIDANDLSEMSEKEEKKLKLLKKIQKTPSLMGIMTRWS